MLGLKLINISKRGPQVWCNLWMDLSKFIYKKLH